MTPNRHPADERADERADLRARITALKMREQALRHRIVTNMKDLTPEGEPHFLDLHTPTRRMFRPDRLPPAVRDRAGLHEVRELVTLRVVPRDPGADAARRKPAADPEDEFDVIERF